MPCGTASRRRSRRPIASSAWTCAAMAGPPRRRATPTHETYSKRAMGARRDHVMEALGHVRFAVVGHDRGARVAYRLALDHPGRRRAAGPPRHPADLPCLGADEGRHGPGGPLGLPVSALSEAGGGDRARSGPLFRGPDAEMVRRPATSARSTTARSRAYRHELQRARRASTPSARITAPARRGTSRPTRPISPPARPSSCPTQLIWSDFYLVQRDQRRQRVRRSTCGAGPSRPKSPGSASSSGHFVAEENPERDAGGAAGVSDRLEASTGALEKGAQQSRRLAFADAAIDLRRVVAGRLVERSARRSRPPRPSDRGAAK